MTIRGAFRSLTKFHVALLIFLFGIVLLFPIGSLILFDSGETRSTDAVRYSELLRHFPADIADAAPSALPANAKSPVLVFFDSGEFLGPPSRSMKVAFVVAPNEAAMLIGRAKAALAGKPLRWDSSNRVRFETGDRSLDIQANLTTGDVSIEIQDN